MKVKDNSSYITIKNGVIASFIAGILSLIIPHIGTFFSRIFGKISSLINWCWGSLINTYVISGWVCLIVLLFAIIGIAFLGIIIIIRLKKEEEYSSYIEDSIHGAIWRWHWNKGRITDLWCFCPKCDATLVYNESYVDTDFMCENCQGKTIATITGGNKDYALNATEREIGRRIRTGEYKSKNGARR